MHMVAGTLGAWGKQVFIEAGRLGQIASELGGTRRAVEHVQTPRFRAQLALKRFLRPLWQTAFEKQFGQ
jgi:hypothetical protein